MLVWMHQSIQPNRKKKGETVKKLREKTLMKVMNDISINKASACEKSVKGDDKGLKDTQRRNDPMGNGEN
ncbi:hypothetical protein EUGRSUZ_H00369 [Eucalyptus grandis]|uniref:Uncharacterized protein n=2 Tax=Eucalyptus grandis TaxID=71139 RepID=A0ACC3JKE6_EUCGR|nr:hypothetical protein EUGRSUZ_H00369 [Eucalyptus grandis]